jgi:hypothetical protein
MLLSFDDLLSNTLANLASSVILIVIGFILGKTWDLTTRVRAFRKVFGKQAGKHNPLYIVLDTLRDTRLLPQHVQQSMKIKSPIPEPPTARYFKLFPDGHYTYLPGPDGLVPECSARGAAYLIDAFRGIRGITTEAISDTSVAQKWNGSFISLGSSYSNIKSDDIKLLPENPWLKDDAGKFQLKDNTTITMDARSDKGIILKLSNERFEGHTLVVCAGLGEWGTSGSAWFLAHNWKALSRRFGRHPFMLVVSVSQGADESANEILAHGQETIRWRAWKWLRSFF